MTFDARTMKWLSAGLHLTSPDFPGLPLEASVQFRSGIHRDKSPLDAHMRQVKAGHRPGMSLHAAVAEWEKLRSVRNAGGDPATDLKQAKVVKVQARAHRKDKLPRRAAYCSKSLR